MEPPPSDPPLTLFKMATIITMLTISRPFPIGFPFPIVAGIEYPCGFAGRLTRLGL